MPTSPTQRRPARRRPPAAPPNERHRHQRPGARRRRARRGEDRRAHAVPGRGRRPRDLRRHRRRGRAARLRWTCPSTCGDGEILLAGDTRRGDRRTASGADGVVRRPAPTRVVVLDVSDPAAPEVEHTYLRQLVHRRPRGCTATPSGWCSQAGLPDLDFVEAGRTRRARGRRGRTARSSASRPSTTGCPTVSTTAATRAARSTARTSPSRRRRQPRHDRGGRLRPPTSPTTASASGLAVDTQLAYVSADQLYLATVRLELRRLLRLLRRRRPLERPALVPGHRRRRRRRQPSLRLRPRRPRRRRTPPPARSTASIRGPLGDGRVPAASCGWPSGPTGQTGNFNSVVTFRQDGNDLVEAGRVDELGVGRADPVDALVRRAGDHGDLPAGRPALRRRPHRPGRAAADGRSSRSPASRRTCTRSASTGCSGSARRRAPDGTSWGAQAGAVQRHRPDRPAAARRRLLRPQQLRAGRPRTRASSPGSPSSARCSP